MKIAITGGPSAGKTTIADVVSRHFAMGLVPESASILFRGGFPRFASGPGVCYQQVAIYHVQRQLEHVISFQNPGRDLVCDRGTLDGLAYWPESRESFFQLVHSSMAAELMRYDWVIDLDSVDTGRYLQTSLRIETPPEARELDRRLQEIWSCHNNYILIRNANDFSKKIERVVHAVQMMYDGERVDAIRNALEESESK